MLSAGGSRAESPGAAASPGEGQDPGQVADPRPDPETLARRREQRAALSRAMRSLPDAERVLLRCRFEEEMTLAQIARLAGLADAQAADRAIQAVLKRLHAALGNA